MGHKIALIFPAFNEELTIKNVILDFHQSCPDGVIYVIDNNSTDKTGIIGRETIASHNINGHVVFVKKQGKANSIREAFRTIDADFYVMVDADQTYFGKDLEMLLKPILAGDYDIAIGNRFAYSDYQNENQRLFHNFGNNIVKFIINFLFQSDLIDIMSGYRVLSKQFVKNYPIMCEGFELETEMTLHALDKKYRIVEIPISYKDRMHGSVSKLNTYLDGFKVLKTIFNVFKDYKPLKFFSTLSLLFFLLGVSFGIEPIYEYIEYRYVYKVPTAILATGMMIFSLLFFAIGIILETIARYNKINYELYKIREP
jgi:glycosyltransferase involved in cell wall biosynthesis